MRIEKFGFDFLFFSDLILSKTNDKKIKIYDANTFLLLKEIVGYGTLQFVSDNYIYTADIENKKTIYKIKLSDYSVTEIVQGTKDAIIIFKPNIIVETTNLPDYLTESDIYTLEKGSKKVLPLEFHFDKLYFFENFIYTNSKKSKSKIQSLSLINWELVWVIELDGFKKELPNWENHSNSLITFGDFKFLNSTIIISIGTPFEQRLACFSIIDGKLIWISKEYNSTGVFHIKNEFAYSIYNNKVVKVNCITGEATMIDISEQSMKAGITMSYNFSLNENYIVGADFKNLKLAVLNMDTWEYDLVHQFVKGKDINKTVWQILVPQYHAGSVYVLDSDDTLHILPIKS